jgi:hypothetical protein
MPGKVLNMQTIPIAVLNASTLVSQEEVLAATAAVQTQVSRDFAPVWNIDADLAVVKQGDPAPSGAWWLLIIDYSDMGVVLGYHDLTVQGLPLAKVFVGTAKQSGQAWTALFSHEVLEMLTDPYTCLTAFGPGVYGSLLYAYEICDACQSENYGYLIGDQLVSDFLYPTWFKSRLGAMTAQFDYGKHIRNPFELLQGGYHMVFDLTFGTGWNIIYPPSDIPTYRSRPRVGSRRERRRTFYMNWLKSVAPIGANFTAANLDRPRISSASTPDPAEEQSQSKA